MKQLPRSLPLRHGAQAIAPRLHPCYLAVALVSAALVGAGAHAAPPLSGAIFTTTEDGSIVNENRRYEAKWEVFLDGGPPPNAPATAAGLPDGDYYFQVTDPSGKDLLSSDHISCRKIRVAGGVIVEYLPDSNYEWNNGAKKWQPISCTPTVKIQGNDVMYHLTAVDSDHGGDAGAITVRLYPFDDTPNPGGVYKAWVTPVADYAPVCGQVGVLTGNTDPDANLTNECWVGGNAHGFISASSKTDNFKVKEGRPLFGIIGLRNYHDANMNCRFDPEDTPYPEQYVFGWGYGVTENAGARNTRFTETEDSADDLPRLIETLGLTGLDVDQFRWTEFQDLNLASRHVITSGIIHNFLPYPLSLSTSELLANEREQFSLGFPCPDDGAMPRDTGPDGLTAREKSGAFDPGMYVTPSNDDKPQIGVSLGEVGFGALTVRKVFDTAGDGPSAGDPPISGWPITLTYAANVLKSGGGPIPDTISTTVNSAIWTAINNQYKDQLAELGLPAGDIPDPLIEGGKVVRYTDAQGEVTFSFLLPNAQATNYYKVEEAQPAGWMTAGLPAAEFDVYSELQQGNGTAPEIKGWVYPDGKARIVENRVENQTHTFANYCVLEPADFDTKGYWHNKNGMTEFYNHPDRDDILAFVNSLPPYATPSSYFGDCDEPFNGKYTGGADCPTAFNNDDGSLVWGAGTVEAEISQFLVDNNAGSSAEYHREQLAQQLLAFIFNVWINADFPLTYSGGVISGGPTIHHDAMGPGVDSNALMNAALTAWMTGADASGVQEQIAGFNEDDTVYIPATLANCLNRYPLPNGS